MVEDNGKIILEQIGLQFMKSTAHTDTAKGNTFITISHSMEFATKDELDMEISRFLSNLLNSRLVSAKLKEKQDTIDNLHRDVTNLQGFHKYKIAYDLNYYMKHGQRNEQQ